ncbi:uncharacterized protein [Nicotiana tomentosiformis]|uniref:uncharacterized protein n=1 Tax=Nicotiana tomentosiformis TaxID=4098 RepID=UPI00388C77B2
MPEAENKVIQASLQTQDLWVLHTDGASNACRSGIGLVPEVPTGEIILQSIKFPNMTNNEAECEAIVAGLRQPLKYGAKRLQLHYDSQLVVNQVTWTLQIKEQRLKKYQTKIYRLLPSFDECQLDQIPINQNVEVDGLAKLAVVTKSVTLGIRV